MKLTKPEGWKVVYEDKDVSWKPPYGYCYQSLNLIVVYRPAWAIWPFRAWIRNKIKQHELAHAWGINGCGKPWCLSFEAGEWKAKWKDIWWEGFLMALSVLNPWSFCKEHRKVLSDKMFIAALNLPLLAAGSITAGRIDGSLITVAEDKTNGKINI